MAGGAADGGSTVTELVPVDFGGNAADAVATVPLGPYTAASF